MSVFSKIRKSNFLIKLSSWEYWPFEVVYFPIFFYWFWLSIKSRSFFFFSASNPGIENGGMLGESKFSILEKIDPAIKPKTFFLKAPATVSHILSLMKTEDMRFPVILKPDIGERGWRVKKISNENELEEYAKDMHVDFLVQEFIDLPMELGVFYYRYPDDQKGLVSSIVMKEMLTVTGDGKSTLSELVLQNDRAKLQFETLEETYNGQMEQVLADGVKKELVAIGNHSLGTKFLDGNYLINQRLNETFDQISSAIDGFFFGRFDLRCADDKALYEGKIKVMELNGAGSEPAHIYNPGFSLRKAYGVLFHHWKVLYEISKINHKKGIKYMTFKEGINEYKKVRQYNKLK
ncbi:MAG: hypothetical protein AAFX87_00615 [Bacteroidota bacterium]